MESNNSSFVDLICFYQKVDNQVPTILYVVYKLGDDILIYVQDLARVDFSFSHNYATDHSHVPYWMTLACIANNTEEFLKVWTKRYGKYMVVNHETFVKDLDAASRITIYGDTIAKHLILHLTDNANLKLVQMLVSDLGDGVDPLKRRKRGIDIQILNEVKQKVQALDKRITDLLKIISLEDLDEYVPDWKYLKYKYFD